MNEITQTLIAASRGDSAAAANLLPLVYDELRQLAKVWLSREPAGQTLQPTALVHEAYLRLIGTKEPQIWDSRGHFFAAAARAMRRILVDAARQRRTLKRGADRQRSELEDLATVATSDPIDLIELDNALIRLAERDSRKAQLVELRFFAGLTMDEAAGALGVSSITAYRDWAYARAWLHREMLGEKSSRAP